MLRSLVPFLGCGLMMLVPMALMGRSNNRNRPNQPSPTAEEVAVKRDEVARLRQLNQQPVPVEETGP